MADILIRHGIVVTVDPERRVIEDGAVAITGNTIVAVGPTAEVEAAHGAERVIDARYKVVMPGFVDAHAHAGHGLIKTIGGGDSKVWFNACSQIYPVGTTPGFWEAEARLSALERLKSGTTTGLSLMGGGDSEMRVDDPRYADLHCEANRAVGIRSVLAMGPCRPPFPHDFNEIVDGVTTPKTVSFERLYEVCEDVLDRWHGVGDRQINICLLAPVQRRGEHDEVIEEAFAQSAKMLELARRKGVVFTQDGHREGSIKLAHEQFGMLGPDVLLSHCIDLLPEEIELLAEHGGSVVHNPSAVMSILGRCPVPELIDAGVTVAIGSDGTAPDRSYDMFRHMFQAMHYHRRHMRDPQVLPVGKALEMVTIDAAKAVGMADIVGSLEVGKRADVVLVDMRKPHLYPLHMPVYRIANFAVAADVDTVLVDGRVLMEGRKVAHLDEDAILDAAQAEIDAALARTGTEGLMIEPATMWRGSHY
ncbi:amidohydrolase family protein [Acuticoccus mangrovi]|uniref:Amidohydrolase family protein n=1 Tax=Acuticoccus mangrovi TaxID=2796142 RepID=A0A934IPT8_9HYPH|nr:amidohydrolase family protein [Acuticoccus mangrovi]MBJ3778801.1 amidohydrolase family protein [Acuticoccus mangrovi]